jgi:putative transposase
MVSQRINLNELELKILTQISKSKTSSVSENERSRILLEISKGLSNTKVQNNLKMSWAKVKRWRDRWLSFEPKIKEVQRNFEGRAAEQSLAKLIYQCLNDEPRGGAKAKITAQMYCQILSVSLESPELSGRPITQWTLDELLDEVLKRKIVPTISRSHLGSFLKRSRRETAQDTGLAEPQVHKRRTGRGEQKDLRGLSRSTRKMGKRGHQDHQHR